MKYLLLILLFCLSCSEELKPSHLIKESLSYEDKEASLCLVRKFPGTDIIGFISVPCEFPID